MRQNCGEALLCVGCIDEQFAADDFAVAAHLLGEHVEA